VRFDWDNAKADRNRQKHGVTFEEALTVFFDSLAITIPDETHSDTEDRELTIGRTNKSRVLTVIHTERITAGDESILRIISARKATKQEQRDYAQNIKDKLS